MSRVAKSNNIWLVLVFASVILSSTGMLSTDAFAQLLPSSLTNTVSTVTGSLGSTTSPVTTQTLVGTVNQTITNILGPQGIVLNNVQSTSGTTDASNKITLSNFGTGLGNDKLLVVGVSANNNGAVSVTFGGVPLTQKISSFNNNDAEIWYLTNPGSSGDIVVTTSGPTQAIVGAYSFANVDQLAPILTTASKSNTSPSSPSMTLITKYPGDVVLDVPSIYGGVTLGSPTCTQGWNDNISGGITGASSYLKVPFVSAVTCNWTASSTDMWDDVGVEIKASGVTIFGINLGGSSGGSTSGGTNSTSSGSNSTSPGTNSTSTGSNSSSTGITVFAHRIPASYWDPCFAATCDQGTGPGVTMWIALYDSNGTFIKGMFTNEDGNTFTGLNPSATYYVYPTDCENCHGDPHDVVFQYWGDNHSSERPRAATVGAQLHAWYSCTNNCAGGP